MPRMVAVRGHSLNAKYPGPELIESLVIMLVFHPRELERDPPSGLFLKA